MDGVGFLVVCCCEWIHDFLPVYLCHLSKCHVSHFASLIICPSPPCPHPLISDCTPTLTRSACNLRYLFFFFSFSFFTCHSVLTGAAEPHIEAHCWRSLSKRSTLAWHSVQNINQVLLCETKTWCRPKGRPGRRGGATVATLTDDELVKL